MDIKMNKNIICPHHNRQGLYKELTGNKWITKCLCAGCDWQGEEVDYHLGINIPTETELKNNWQ